MIRWTRILLVGLVAFRGLLGALGELLKPDAAYPLVLATRALNLPGQTR